VRGRSIEEAVRNPELQEFVALTLSKAVVQEREISFFDDAGSASSRRTAPGSPTPAATASGPRRAQRRHEHPPAGADAPGLRRQRLARDPHAGDVAQGFIETLQDGAIDDPEAARRFLAIMKKNADRLHAIIEDLLNLSRIEREAERGEVPLEEASLHGIVEEALEASDASCRRRRSGSSWTARAICRCARTRRCWSRRS